MTRTKQSSTTNAEPSHTDPGHEAVRRVTRAAAEVRVGGSDARLFRAEGLPTVVHGPTPFGTGGADGFALVDDLATVAEAYALAAWGLLEAQEASPCS